MIIPVFRVSGATSPMPHCLVSSHDPKYSPTKVTTMNNVLIENCGRHRCILSWSPVMRALSLTEEMAIASRYQPRTIQDTDADCVVNQGRDGRRPIKPSILGARNPPGLGSSDLGRNPATKSPQQRRQSRLHTCVIKGSLNDATRV